MSDCKEKLIHLTTCIRSHKEAIFKSQSAFGGGGAGSEDLLTRRVPLSRGL